MESNQQEAPRLIRIKDVRHKVGFGRSTIYKLVSENRFPKPIAFSNLKVSFWVESEVDHWISACIASRNAAGLAQ